MANSRPGHSGSRPGSRLRSSRRGRCSLDRQLTSLDCPGEPFGDHLEEFGVGNLERAGLEPADMKHTDQLVCHEERHAEHGADPLLPKDRVRDRGRVDPIQAHRLLRPGDASGETDADRHPDALADLLLDTARRPGDEITRVLVEKQHGCGVRVENARTRSNSSTSRSSTSRRPSLLSVTARKLANWSWALRSPSFFTHRAYR